MKKILTILFLAIAANSFATDYYVRTDGNNGNTGTVNTSGGAWLTVEYALTNATTSGDIIHFGSGTWTIAAQGVLAVGVSMEGVDSNSTIIQGSLTTDFTALIRAYSATQGTNGNQHISGIRFNGVSRATDIGVQFMGRSNCSVYNCAFVDFDFAGVAFSGQPNLFDNQTEPTTYATGNSLYNSSFVNCSGFKNWAGSTYGSGQLWMMGQDGMDIYNCNFNQTQRPTRQDGWPIKATDWNKNIHIYNSTLRRSRYPYSTPGNFDGTAQYWDFAYEGGDVIGLEINNCNIYGSIDVNRNEPGAGGFSVSIHDNVIGYDSFEAGYVNGVIFEYQTHNAIVRNNEFKNITNVIEFSTRSLSQVYDIEIKNNLGYGLGDADGNHQGGFVHFISDGSNNYLAKNFYCQWNTMLFNASFNPFYGISLSNSGSVDSAYFDNNIITNCLDNYIGANTATPINHIWIRNNLVSGNGNSNDPKWDAGTPTNAVVSGIIKSAPTFQSGTYFLDAASAGYQDATDGTNIGYEGGSSNPYVLSTNPVSGATGVPTGNTIVVSFNEALDGATVNTTNCYITGVTSSVTLAGGDAIQINPAVDLAYSTTYTVTITTAVTDVAGNPLASNYTFSFTTQAAPAAGGGRVKVLKGIKIIN